MAARYRPTCSTDPQAAPSSQEAVSPLLAASFIWIEGESPPFRRFELAGGFLDGTKITSVRADETCIDAGAATAAAERLVTSDGVSGIVGPTCSGATTSKPTSTWLPITCGVAASR